MANNSGKKNLNRTDRVEGLAQRLVKLRGFRSRSSLVADLGYNPVTYSSWETGRTEPKLLDLVRICQYFNCSTDYLLGLSSDKTPVAAKSIGDNNHNASIDSPNSACADCPMSKTIAQQAETIANLSRALVKA